MTSEFSRMRDHWAEWYLNNIQHFYSDISEIAIAAYKFADAMMKEAGYDPGSTDQPKGN